MQICSRHCKAIEKWQHATVLQQASQPIKQRKAFAILAKYIVEVLKLHGS